MIGLKNVQYQLKSNISCKYKPIIEVDLGKHKLLDKFILAIVLMVSSIAVTAKEIPRYEISDDNIQLYNFDVGYLVDTENTMSFHDVEDSIFQLTNSQFSIKSGQYAYWFKIKLKNSSTQALNRMIGFDEVFMENAEIYYETNDGVYSRRSGIVLPITERLVKNRCPVFYTQINSNDSLDVYLKLHSKFTNTLNIVVADVPSFILKEQKSIIWHWFYFGAAISIILYNLILYFQIRERVYLYYVIYSFCFVFLIFLYSGFSLYIIPSKMMHYKLHASFAISLAFTGFFTRHFLNVKSLSRWLDNLLLGIIILYFVLAILIIYDIEYYKWVVIFGVPSSSILFLTAIYCFYRKAPLSGIYLVACGGYIIGLLITALGSLGVIPFNSFVRHAFTAGSLFEFIMLSLALGRRYKLLQEEKLSYQTKLINTEKEMTTSLELKVIERTKELKRTNDKLLELDQFKQGMTGMIVHDLKNPLNSIINLAKDVHVIQRGKQMLNMVLNILDVHKYEEIQMIVDKIDHSLYQLSQSAINEVAFLADQKLIAIINNIETQIAVKCDKEITERIFVNLLTNAIKYSPNNTSIEISADQEEDDFIKICVVDAGKGIPKEQLNKVFDKFGQIEAKKSGEIRSTGLGLTFCKLAVEAHGGIIGVDSDGEHSSIFWFTLRKAQNVQIDYEKEADSRIELKFSANEKELLVPVILQLQQLNFYEVSKIRRAISTIGSTSNINILKWKAEVLNAISSGNELLYLSLIKHSDHEL